jgi:hypothetical protein
MGLGLGLKLLSFRFQFSGYPSVRQGKVRRKVRSYELVSQLYPVQFLQVVIISKICFRKWTVKHCEKVRTTAA